MASPFHSFRKYQKSFLVVAGVILMFVFVLGDPLSQYLRNNAAGPGGAGRSPNATAVKWDGGSLSNAELNQLVVQRLVVNNFLRNVEGMGYQAAIDSGAEPQPLRVTRILGVERPEQGVEQDVLRTHLMAEAARQAGMAISDDYIVNYLMQLGRGFVSVDTIRQILNSMQVGGRQASIDFVFDALRHEMLARNYLESFSYALQTELPEDRWRDWLRVNDRVTVEAVAVPAESLLVDVKEPTDAELEEFFNEFKDREPLPDTNWGIELPSPNPAFRVPQKVAVQYLKADFNQFLAKAEEEVTDAEIEKFYADNKENLFQSAGSLLGDAGDLTGVEEKDAGEEKTEPGTAETETDAASESSDAAPIDDANAAPAPNDGSRRASESPFRLTAFQEEGSADPATTETEPAGAPEAADKPAAAPASAAADQKYQPLEEVRDEIRRTIAELKVAEQLSALVNSLESKLNESYMNYLGATLDAEDAGKKAPAPPEALADLTPLAKEHGLTYEKTELATWQQLRDTEIGNSKRPEWGNTPFYAAILSPDYEPYEPVATQDLDANRYIAMKTADVPGKVPTLKEVRDDVVKAWKLREAGKLALKKAEDLAKAANDKGGSLADAIAGDSALSVIKTNPFAFFTVGSIIPETQQVRSFRLSEPDGIVAGGPEFMEVVFNLKDGAVGAAPNHNKSVAYVVKIADHQNTPAELQQAFLGEDFAWYGVPAMSRGHYETALRVLVSDMMKSAHVEWERDPDQLIQQTEEESEETEVSEDTANADSSES